MDQTLPLVRMNGEPEFTAPMCGLLDTDSKAADRGAYSSGANGSGARGVNWKDSAPYDYWTEGEPGTIVRIHVKPRQRLFDPTDARGDKNPLEGLSGKRVTIGTYGDEQRLIFEDN